MSLGTFIFPSQPIIGKWFLRGEWGEDSIASEEVPIQKDGSLERASELLAANTQQLIRSEHQQQLL